MAVIVAVIVMIIYLLCPLIGKIALLMVNTVVPDPIPFVDEFIMWVGLMHNLSRMTKIALFIKEHKFLSFLIFVCIIIALFILFI